MGAFETAKWDTNETQNKACKEIIKGFKEKKKRIQSVGKKKNKVKNSKKNIVDKLKHVIDHKRNKKNLNIDANSKIKPIHVNRSKKRKKPEQNVLKSEKVVECKSNATSLRDRMLARLQASRFRYINERMYSTTGKDAQEMFNNDSDAFKSYHSGYRQQVKQWPINPLDLIINRIRKMPKSHIIADFGCGEAKLAQSVQQEVHSFDLVALNDFVTPCDMANVPLENSSIDVVVFCLSLMGTNLQDYILEANRVLKMGGILKVAEVESRFGNIEEFIKNIKKFGFNIIAKDLSRKVFYLMDFKKVFDIKKKKNLPVINLQPCLYKKR